MSKADLVIRGDIVTPERVMADGYIAVIGEAIEAIGEGAPPAAFETQDCRGCWIIPGVVDGQTHAASQLNQEGLGLASRAAAAGSAGRPPPPRPGELRHSPSAGRRKAGAATS